jgi:hypothetical protein
MSSEDTLTVHIGIILFGVTVVSRETLVVVRDIKSTVSSSLKGSENTASGGSSTTSNIKKSTEWTLVLVNFINVVSLLSNLGLHNLGVNLSVTLIDLIKTNLLQKTTGYKKTGTVCSRVVFKTNLKSVTLKFLRTSLSKDTVSVNERVSNLTDNVSVGETNNKTVLGRLVLVLGLTAKTFALTVVGTSLTSTTELNLVAAEVGFALLYLGESL